MEESPFKDLKISDNSFLDDLEGRTACPKCSRTRKYYCYTCFVPMEGVGEKLPRVKLPVKVDVIKHPSEVDGKSTAAHAAVIASEDVTIYTYPVIPDYSDKSRILLLFPGEKSSTLEELAAKHKTSVVKVTKSQALEEAAEVAEDTADLKHDIELKVGAKRTLEETSDGEPAKKQSAVESLPYDRIVFIDSTWNQTLKIYRDERLQGLQQVELKSRTTKFWRHQKEKPDTYLATIEAIYYFFVDFHDLFLDNPHDGIYDNLLFFFSYMYTKIRCIYKGGKQLKAYQKKETTKSQVN